MQPFAAEDHLAVTALRVLAIDQIEKARSGHPGLPLGAAPMAYVLWSRFLRHDPQAPTWPDRDRFVLSAGHGSALLYALLHLFGYDLPIGELQRFRQLGSRTPGHPEHGLTPGVETTTGPLGQGLANAVGMALAERHLAERFNQSGHQVVGHRTWVIAGDGDMMEGISHEAASLAGHLKLGKLVVLYDDNHITIEGSTSLAFSEDVGARYAAYGWSVLHVEDGNSLEAIAGALSQAKDRDDAPVLIRVRTHIGYGSPKQDSAAVHGAPLGAEAAAATRTALGWPITEPFVVPDEVYAHVRANATERAAVRTAWQAGFDRYRAACGELGAELARRWRGELPADWDLELPVFSDGAAMATREASGKLINGLARRVPELIGGSADLAPSNNTLIDGGGDVAGGVWGTRNLRFGVREHAMAAIANGLALHGGVRVYVATFLVFADYLRPALRLAALMELPVVYVFTHDSIAVGEDGPTHQPVEHIVSLRIVPGMVVLRPADAHETREAWRVALGRSNGPTALLLTRQKLPSLPPPPAGAVERGAYVKVEASDGAPEIVLVATGSEVQLALAARELLEREGFPTRVVSAPSLELLARQSPEYQRATLGPKHALRVAIEMGRGQGWHRWIGDGEMIVLSRFGASGPAEALTRELGFTAGAVAARVRAALATRQPTPLSFAVPAALEPAVAAAGQKLVEARFIDRLTAHDSALWGDEHVRSVATRLGWLDLPQRARAELPALTRLVEGLAADGADTLLLLGMGGSSLAPSVLRAVGGDPSGRVLHVLDTTDPERFLRVLDSLDLGKVAVVAVSKSGTTVETSSQLEILWHRVGEVLGEGAGARFVALTEPASALVTLALTRHFRAVLPHPVDVGGRFSALSAVGLLPALWLGLDADALLRSGAAALTHLNNRHPALQLATHLAARAHDGFGVLAWCASPRMMPAGVWAEQLIAESTGKLGRGVLPVIVDPMRIDLSRWPATTCLSVRFAGEDTSALDQALDRLAAAGTPVLRWTIDAGRIGELFVMLELATAATGLLWGVNPFDEPDVVRAKERARAALSAEQGGYPMPTPEPARALATRLGSAPAFGAIVLLAYLAETDENAALLEQLSERLATVHACPVTWAFGPRYLHSTGQLHKGGPRGIVPIVLTGEPARDLAIPGQQFTLGQLRWAQALGDLGALQEAGRAPLHLHLGAAATSALQALTDAR
jgi:transketolase